MIFNTCIYGTVKDSDDNLIVDSKVDMKYVSYDFSKVIEKEFVNTTGAYQFNLGDSDILTLNTKADSRDVVVISNVVDDEVTYSAKEVVGDRLFIEHNMIDSGSNSTTTDEASSDDVSKTSVTKVIHLVDSQVSLYSYYKVEFDDVVIYEQNGSELYFRPKVLGEHKITQSAINSTTGDISSKEYTIDVLQTENQFVSLDYIYYTKRKKVIRIELPQFVKDSLILADGFYYEGNLLIGKVESLKSVVMEYYNGKVILKSYLGDILDY